MSQLSPWYRTVVVALLVVALGAVTLGWGISSVAATQPSAGSEATVVSIDHAETVPPDGSFEITVETSNSAGTTVVVEPTGFDVDVSSDSGTVDGNQVRFLDVSAGDSTHTVTVDVSGGENGASAEIAAWVNAADRGDADDVATSTIDIETIEDDSSGSDDTSDQDDTDNDADEDSDDGDAANGEPETTEDVESEETDEQTSSSANQNNETMSSDEQADDDDESGTTEQVDESTNTEDPADDSETEGGTDSSIPGFGVVTSITALAWYTIARLGRRSIRMDD